MSIDNIQQTITDIKITEEKPKLSKVKKDTLKLLQEYPLTYKEFEEYINYLNQIKNESLLMVLNLEEYIKNENIPLRDKVSLY